MTILNLVAETDPILRETMPEYDFSDDELSLQLALDLTETMLSHRGLGLSANQVGLRHRVFVMRTEPIRVCFNPRIVDMGTETLEFEEGCLSVPNVILNITRPRRIRARFTLPNGETVTEVFHDMTARVYQHELDHLNGVLFIDHASKLKVDIARRKGSKIIRVGE